MPIVTLLLQDLRTGERMTAAFETMESCTEWLRARPAFIDVLGPVDEDLLPDGDRMLRAALRPHDDAERALLGQQRQQQSAELAAVAAAQQQRTLFAQQARQEQVARLGADEPMVVVWSQSGTVVNAEPLDVRPVPQVVVDAVLDWVAERNRWVHARGQVVCAAHVTVWPGAVPAGEERVHFGGQFECAPA